MPSSTSTIIRANGAVFAASAVVLVVTYLIRLSFQSQLQDMPIVGALATLFTYAIPGAVVGSFVKRSWLVTAALLGLLSTALFIVKELLLRPVVWPVAMVLEFLAIFAAFGVIGCIAGALLGRVVIRRMFSNKALERSRVG